MEMNEFVIAGGALVAGVILLVVAAQFMGGEAKKAEYEDVKGDAERIAIFLDRLYYEPFEGQFEIEFDLCDIRAENGFLTVSRRERAYMIEIPHEVENFEYRDAVSLCVVKSGEVLTVLLECPA
ncbi:MAG: hypothetical protein ACP5E4_00185 [Candidatus Aenigmatarchaeota archaeon]